MAEFKKRGGFGGGSGGFKKSEGRSSFGGKSFGGKPRFAGKSSFGSQPGFKRPSRDGEERVMHDAICAKCNKPCQVPFRPTGGKEVLCRDCFRANDSFSSDRPMSSGYPKRDAGTPAFVKPRAPDTASAEIKKQLEQVNIKLDTLIELLKKA